MAANHPKKKTQTSHKKYPLAILTGKMLFLVIVILVGLYYSDSKGYFNSDQTNNHVIKKWRSFYDFTRVANVDILLLGNSHLYTGINPQNLSNALGANAFILAAPATSIVDHYFVLKEALKRTKPKVVVVETYGIQKVNQHQLNGGKLAYQFMSFSARKDFWTKLVSTPSLFAPKNYAYAWSTTLRNHNLIYTKYEQIRENIKIRKQQQKRKNHKLYLGRFIRFQQGIQDSTLKKYQKQGCPVDGQQYTINKATHTYVKKIKDLCLANKIKLVFLTVPMYKQHICHYNTWKQRLQTVINDDHQGWLDLQITQNYKGFTSESFENTYLANQHLTYNGSLLATYKLADYLKTNKNIQLPERSTNASWRDLFYGSDGFFENNLPYPQDANNRLIAKDQHNGIKREVIQLKRGKINGLILKITSQDKQKLQHLKGLKARLMVTIKYQGKLLNQVAIEMPFDKYHSMSHYVNYMSVIKPIEIIKVNRITFVKK